MTRALDVDKGDVRNSSNLVGATWEEFCAGLRSLDSLVVLQK